MNVAVLVECLCVFSVLFLQKQCILCHVVSAKGETVHIRYCVARILHMNCSIMFKIHSLVTLLHYTEHIAKRPVTRYLLLCKFVGESVLLLVSVVYANCS